MLDFTVVDIVVASLLVLCYLLIGVVMATTLVAAEWRLERTCRQRLVLLGWAAMLLVVWPIVLLWAHLDQRRAELAMTTDHPANDPVEMVGDGW